MLNAETNRIAVPPRVVLSGEGLETMTPFNFLVLTQMLGGMGIKVEPLAEESVQSLPPDIPIYLPDFKRHAERLYEPRAGAGVRAWRAITHSYDRYQEGLRRTDRNDQQRLERVALGKPWVGNLCIASKVVSTRGLAYAVRKQIITEITGLGPSCMPLLESITAEFCPKIAPVPELE